MHPQHFDTATAVYSNSLYGPVTGYDASSIKFQHSGYMPPEHADPTSCYSNYVSSQNLQSLQGYGMRGDPPGYSDTASFFHPGIVSNFGSPTPPLSSSSSSSSFLYNKSISRTSDINGDYSNTIPSLTPKTPESFLLKPPDPLNPCASPHDYNTTNSDNSDSINNINSTNNAPNASNCHNNTSTNMFDHQLNSQHHHHLHTLTPFHHHQHNHHQHPQHHHHHLQLSNPYHDENVHNNPTDPSIKLTNHNHSFFNTTTTDNNNATNNNCDLKMDSLIKMEPITTSTSHDTDHTKLPPMCDNINNNSTNNNTIAMPESNSAKAHQENISMSPSSSLSSTIHSATQGDDNAEESKDTDDKSADTTSGGINVKKEDGDGKPTMSYIALIAKAILESDQRRLNLGAIYGWIEKHYPFYKTKGQGWRNSVRHNLSLNDCFIKAGRCEDGKGNYWAIHPANIQDFIRGDFRQRRRSRRRGRKKECDLGMYHVANGYLQPGSTPLASQMTLNSATLSSIYSPYTEAERRAYRLDEALLRQSMNNPFVKWYQHGVSNPATGSPTCSPAGMYANTTGSMQWPHQAYPDTSPQTMYPTSLNTSFSRQYPSAPVL